MSALLLFGDTARSAALRHEIPVEIIDPLLFCSAGGRTRVLTFDIERSRIERHAPEVEVLDYFEFGMKELRQSGLSSEEAQRESAVRALRHLGVRSATVAADFPLGLADRLRADGVELTVDDAAVRDRRRRKSPRELEGIAVAQRSAESGMAAAADMLARAEPGPDGRLHRDGVELHSEHVRAALRDACHAAGAPCPPDVMVASVWSGYGHEPGSGPLPAGLPIIVDLWPRDEESACWADMTRTFVVGAAPPEHAELIEEQEQLVRAAIDAAISSIRPGITGRELYDAACDRFEAAGYATQRTGPGEHPHEGFQFSLGHGVGLEIHEAPILGLAGAEALVEGDVVAVEPGLWDRRIGSVRFEDLVLVTGEGCEVLTRYAYDLTPARG